MLYFKIKNYEEFKSLFGVRVANNGKKVRSNSILLSFWKHELMNKRFFNLQFKSMDVLYSAFTKYLGHSTNGLANGMNVYHPDYDIDSYRGVCEDGDSRCIRYKRRDNDRVFKMKAGKFMRLVLEYNGYTDRYCEQFNIYLCERFAEDWKSCIESRYNYLYTLNVDDNFERIYSGYNCVGNFHSCMTNNEQYTFYENAVDAKAAYLTNSDDKIVARCVIFNEVHDLDSGEVYRLAERQYSTDQDNVLKQILITKLIEAGEIDGYKQIGVDCHNSRGFILNDGTSLRNHRLWIHCDLDYDDTLSYQDSFKWFDMDYQRADNYGLGSIDLATTASRLEYEGAYDEYHDRYCAEVRTVYVWNGRYEQHDECTCDVDCLENFTWCERYCDYYEEVHYSSYEDEYIPREAAIYSEYLNDYLWDDRCSYCEEMEDYLPNDDFSRFFEKWKEENWEYDELNDEYVPETVIAYIWNDEEYEEKNVGVEYAEEYLLEYEGEYYSVLNEDGVPFHLAEELCEAV